MKFFKTLALLPLIGLMVCSCSPTTSSLNSSSSVASVEAKPIGLAEESAQAYTGVSKVPLRTKSKNVRRVRTTAYSHAENEKGGIYGRKNAIGVNLKYGKIRSAAADWSRYPLGTKFRIVGQPYIYVIDDYGSALVGTDTVDIYKPNLSLMNDWGVRHIDIEILEWGCYKSSYTILGGRIHKAAHCHEMYKCIAPKIGA